jgi:hypothetical protein
VLLALTNKSSEREYWNCVCTFAGTTTLSWQVPPHSVGRCHHTQLAGATTLS